METDAYALVEPITDNSGDCNTSRFVNHAQVDNISLVCTVNLGSTSASAINEVESVEETQGNSIENVKELLKIRELKQFQISCLAAIKRGEDTIVVQPTGSGKSICFTLPPLLSPGKISLVIEPVVYSCHNKSSSDIAMQGD